MSSNYLQAHTVLSDERVLRVAQVRGTKLAISRHRAERSTDAQCRPEAHTIHATTSGPPSLHAFDARPDPCIVCGAGAGGRGARSLRSSPAGTLWDDVRSGRGAYVQRARALMGTREVRAVQHTHGSRTRTNPRPHPHCSPHNLKALTPAPALSLYPSCRFRCARRTHGWEASNGSSPSSRPRGCCLASLSGARPSPTPTPTSIIACARPTSMAAFLSCGPRLFAWATSSFALSVCTSCAASVTHSGKTTPLLASPIASASSRDVTRPVSMQLWAVEAKAKGWRWACLECRKVRCVVYNNEGTCHVLAFCNTFCCALGKEVWGHARRCELRRLTYAPRYSKAVQYSKGVRFES